MKGRLTDHSGKFMAAIVSVAFLWTLALSAAPQLHQGLHPDANNPEHSCAVTFITSGNYDHPAQAPLITAPIRAVQFSTVPALNPQWVQSLFLDAHVFEHAPPTNS